MFLDGLCSVGVFSTHKIKSMGNLSGTRSLTALCRESFYMWSKMCGLDCTAQADFSLYLGKT